MHSKVSTMLTKIKIKKSMKAPRDNVSSIMLIIINERFIIMTLTVNWGGGGGEGGLVSSPYKKDHHYIVCKLCTLYKTIMAAVASLKQCLLSYIPALGEILSEMRCIK